MNVTQEKDPVILCWLQICKENLLLTQGTLRKKEDASARVTNKMQGRTQPLDFGPAKFRSSADLPTFAPLNLKSCSACDLGKQLHPNVPQFPLCRTRGTGTCLCPWSSPSACKLFRRRV